MKKMPVFPFNDAIREIVLVEDYWSNLNDSVFLLIELQETQRFLQ